MMMQLNPRTKSLTNYAAPTRTAVLSLVFLLLTAGCLHGQMDCKQAAPIPATATDKSVETNAALDVFKAMFKGVPPISAQAQVKASVTQREVLAQYPKADVIALRQQELSYVCQLLNADTTMKTTDKIALLQSVGEGIAITKPMTPTQPSTRPHTVQPASAPPPTPPPAAQPTQTVEIGPGAQVNVHDCAALGNDNKVTCNPDPNAISTIYVCQGNFMTKDPTGALLGSFSSIQDGFYPNYFSMYQLAKSGKNQELLQACSKQYAEHPEWITPLLFCSGAAFELGQHDEAIQYLHKYQAKKNGWYEQPESPCPAIEQRLKSALEP